MSSQTQVRELFSLPKKEVIFDDFGCTFSKGILHQGRMYITENYICFYSSIMGISKKIIIPMNDITKIVKCRTIGIIKALKIYKQGKKHSYTFSSFSDIDKTYSIIHRLWVNVSPNAKGEVLSSEDDDTIDDTQSLASLVVKPQQFQERARTESQKNPPPLIVNQDNPLNNSIQGPKANISGSPSKLGKTSASSNEQERSPLFRQQPQQYPVEEFKKESDFELIIMQDQAKQAAQGPNAFQQPSSRLFTNSTASVEDVLFDSVQLPRKVPEQTQEKPKMKVEKAQGVNEIAASKEKEAGSAYEYITKEELERLFDDYPLSENCDEVEKIFLNMTPQDFLKNVAIHTGEHSFEKFYTDRGEQKIETQPWCIPDPAEEYDGKPVIQASSMSVDIQIKDNPFIKVSPTTKYFKLIEKTDTKVQIKVLSKCTGVPYCDTFAIEEEFLALSPGPNAPCCVVRIVCQILFYKSTIFKSKIVGGAIKGVKQVWGEFSEWLKKRGTHFKEKKQQGVGKLRHGIEKSNKLFEKKLKNETMEQQVPKTAKEKIMRRISEVRKKTKEYRFEIMFFILFLFMAIIYSKLCDLEQKLSLRNDQI